MILRVGNIKVTCYSIPFRFTIKILMPFLVERPNYNVGYYNVWNTRVIHTVVLRFNCVKSHDEIYDLRFDPVRREWFPREGVFPGSIIALVTARK